MSWRRRLWNWSFVPCGVFLFWFADWARSTVDHFVAYGIYVDSEPFVPELGTTGQRELQWRLRSLRIAWSPPPPAPGGRRLREVHLSVDPDALARLDSDLPYSGREYVQGRVGFGSATTPVDVRYRGDTLIHWGHPKKSFRLRARSGNALAGMPVCNLVVGKYPEQINNHLSYRLAESLGLLAPRVELVTVTLNGSFHGPYQLVEQVDAPMLRAAGRGRGTLFVGELLKRDAWRGTPNDLFVHSGRWEARSVGGRTDRARSALTDLLEALNAPACEGSIARLTELLDIEQFARLSVLEQLTQTHHFDHFHNWRLFWNEEQGRFEPVVWDPVGWQDTMRPVAGSSIDVHPVFTPLHARLHAHAGFLAARDRVLRRFFDGGRDRSLLAEMVAALRDLEGPLAADPRLLPPDDQRIATAQRGFAAFVRHNLAAMRDAWDADRGTLRWRRSPTRPDALVVEIARHRPVADLRVELGSSARPRRLRLGVPRPEGDGEEVDLEGHWRIEGSTVVLDLPFPAAVEPIFAWHADRPPVRNCRRAIAATCYVLVLDGTDSRDVVGVREGGGRAFDHHPDLRLVPTRDLFALVP